MPSVAAIGKYLDQPLLTAKINGAGEFWVEDLPTANISRTYDNKTGLQIFDF